MDSKWHWVASARYEDGTSIEQRFEPQTDISEFDDQYNLECWLIGRHEGCIWYSVDVEYETEND